MNIDTSKLIPKGEFNVENFRKFIMSNVSTVQQILKDKEEYKEQCKHVNDSKEDS